MPELPLPDEIEAARTTSAWKRDQLAAWGVRGRQGLEAGADERWHAVQRGGPTPSQPFPVPAQETLDVG